MRPICSVPVPHWPAQAGACITHFPRCYSPLVGCEPLRPKPARRTVRPCLYVCCPATRLQQEKRKKSKDPEKSVLEGLPTRVVEKKDTRKGNTRKSPEGANLGVVAIAKINYSTCSNVQTFTCTGEPCGHWNEKLGMGRARQHVTTSHSRSDDLLPYVHWLARAGHSRSLDNALSQLA